MTKRLTAIGAAALLTVSLAACSEGGKGAAEEAAKPAPTLEKADLEKAAVEPADLPSKDWKRDEKGEKETDAQASAGAHNTAKPTASTQGCDLDSDSGPQPARWAIREFEKGEGMNTQGLQVKVGQFATEDEAKESFKLGDTKFRTCREASNEQVTASITVVDGERVADESGVAEIAATSQGVPVKMRMVYSRRGTTLTRVTHFAVATADLGEDAKVALTKQDEKLKAALDAKK